MKMRSVVMLIFLLSGCNNVKADDIKEGNSVDLSSCRICGLVNLKKEIRTSIVRGEIVQPPNKYPWMVAIQINRKTECGGSILNEYYILTAAHCLTKSRYVPQNRWYILLSQPFVEFKLREYMQLGKNLAVSNVWWNEYCVRKAHTSLREYGAPFQDIPLEFLKPNEITVAFLTQTGEVEPGPPIEEIIPHPGFSFKDFKRDISLLKLSSKLTCNQFRNPICLPSANLTVDIGKQFTIAGWGEDENQELSKQLKEARVEYRNISECRPYVSYRMVEYMKDHFHCIKGLRNQSACLGDSGGPAFDEILGKYYAFSVGSLTHNNCTLGAPFLHTSVFKHIHWIKEVMGSSFPGTIEQHDTHLEESCRTKGQNLGLCCPHVSPCERTCKRLNVPVRLEAPKRADTKEAPEKPVCIYKCVCPENLVRRESDLKCVPDSQCTN